MVHSIIVSFSIRLISILVIPLCSHHTVVVVNHGKVFAIAASTVPSSLDALLMWLDMLMYNT